MITLQSTSITGCHECVATLTLPLALFLLLSETAVGGMATVAYLKFRGGLTQGFLKFIAVTYAQFGAVAFLVGWAGPPGSYRSPFAINQVAAVALVFFPGLLFAAFIVNAVLLWRNDDSVPAG